MFRFMWMLMAASVIGGLCGAGCRTPPSAGVRVESYPKNTITVGSRVLGGWLTVAEVNTARKNDLLQAQVTVYNETQSDCQFEYRYEWFDKDGMEVTTPLLVWIPIGVSAKEKKALTAIAPTRGVEDFRFVVRFRRPSLRWTN